MAADTLFTVDTTTVVLIIEGLLVLVGVMGGFIVRYIIGDLKAQIKTNHEEFDDYKTSKEIELKEVKNDITDAAQDATEIKIALPSNYVSKIEFGRLVDAIFSRFDAVMTKIDGIKDHVDQRLDKMGEKLDSKQDKTDV